MAEILAQDYIKIAESPDPQTAWAGTPTLTRTASGNIVAGYEWFRRGELAEAIPDQMEIQVSGDDGYSWRKVSTVDMTWGTVFAVGEDLYSIGSRRKSRDIVIVRSTDGGITWSKQSVLFGGPHHTSATNIVFKNGFVYKAYETCPPTGRNSWQSLVLAGEIAKDLLNPSAWRMSNKLSFPAVPGVLTQYLYTSRSDVAASNDSFLEGNVVDVRGDMRVMLRTMIDKHTTTGIASVCRFEDNGKDIEYRFLQFYPMPGAQGKFHILYDDQSDLFWTAVNIATDPWQDRAPLRAIGYSGQPGNERRILMLQYSLDSLNWFHAGCVAMSTNPLDSFSYTSNLVAGDDLLILSRTSENGLNQHDTNLITLHRIKDFRRLALDVHPGGRPANA